MNEKEAALTEDLLADAGEERSFLSANPVLSGGAFLGGKAKCPTLYDVSNPLITTSGRMAIALAIENANIGPGDEVLIPSYHCNSMVTPVVNAGSVPVFYKIHQDMHADLADIREKITPKTKGILITHYFGFAQPLSELRSLCDELKLILIEDCAHAFFGKVGDRAIGSYGDYAIGSIMKFFPVFDGGCLVSARHKLPAGKLRSGGKNFELQSALNLLELSFQYNRLILLKWLLFIPLTVKNQVWGWIKNNRISKGKSTQSAPAASCGGIDFDPRWIHVQGSICTRMMLKLLSTNRIINRRRANYTYLLERFSGSDLYQPLFAHIPESVIPYVFPLLVNSPDPNFYKLRAKGLPLLRWEALWNGVDKRVCEVSSHYSRHLIQIPCHQEFSKSDLEYMASTIIDTLTVAKKIHPKT